LTKYYGKRNTSSDYQRSNLRGKESQTVKVASNDQSGDLNNSEFLNKFK